MTKLITILFLATVFWLFMFSTANVITTFAIRVEKVIKRYIKKWRKQI